MGSREELWMEAQAADRAQRALKRLGELGLAEFTRDPAPERLWHGTSVPVAVVLERGWHAAMPWRERPVRIPLASLPGFGGFDGLWDSARELQLGWVGDNRVIALIGPLQLNEDPHDVNVGKMVRLQMEVLCLIGGMKTFILAGTVGGLASDLPVDSFAVVDGFVTLYAPDLPIYAGEPCSLKEVLDQELQELASKTIREVDGLSSEDTVACGHVMVRGPHVGWQEYDRALLAATGAGMFGANILPEAAVVAACRRGDVRVLGLGHMSGRGAWDRRAEQRLKKILAEIIVKATLPRP